MYKPQYTATATLFLPAGIENLPFYNLTVTVEGNSIGSSYAMAIASSLFKNFTNLCSKRDLQTIMDKVKVEDIRKDLQFDILDGSNGNAKINEGASSVAFSVINYLWWLIEKEVKA